MLYTKVNGSMANVMDKASYNTRMERDMKGRLEIACTMEPALFSMRMETNTSANGCKTRDKEWGF